MKKALTPILLLLLTLQSFAQQNVPPCPQPGSSYFAAPLLDCCLDGYHFMTQPVGGLETPIGFCGTVDNGQWLAFMAGSHVTGMTIGIEVTNCLNQPNNQGIQMQVFGIGNSCGLSSLFPVSNCIETNGLDSVTATNLVAGHVYYILLDGNGGDICEYTISVLDVEQCPPPTPYLSGPTLVNQGSTETYTLVRPPDTCDYELHNPCNNIKQDTVTCAGLCTDNTPADTTWTGPPGSTIVPIPGTLSANITFGPISGFVTITITGPCHYETYSLYVEVCQFLPPPIISGPQQLCEGEAATYTASFVPGAFFYDWSLPSNIPYTPIAVNAISVPSPVSGLFCVSVLNNCSVSVPSCIPVTVYDNPVVQLGTLNLCQDDLPYNFNGETVTTSGYYTVVLNNWNGCDSIVMQQINVLPAVTTSITSTAGTMLPIGGSTILDAGNGFASYQWQGGASGQTLSVDQPGTYSVTVTNAAGCTATASITLTQATANCPNFNSPIAPADSCATAPSFCGSYLNGYCSTNDGYTPDVPGNLGSVIPCTLENNQWLKFTACDSTVDIELSVGNCFAAMGLEFFVLQTTDCQIFNALAACYEIANGASDTLHIDGLTTGQTYYLMVDGIAGDICSWEVLSTSGVSEGAVYQAQNTPGQVESVGDVDSYCVGGTGSFYFTPADCGLSLVSGCPAFQQVCTPQMDTCTAIQFDTIWHVTPAGTIFENNDSIGANVNIIFPDTLSVPTGGFLEFTVAVEFVPISQDTFTCWNDCLVECSTILPDSQACAILPKTIKVCAPDNQAITFDLCPGDCVDFMGGTYCNPGIQTVTQQDICGCTDTYVITINWILESPPIVSQEIYSCSADGTTYTVSFTVEGFGSMILIDGQPLAGNSFTSAPIPSGAPYSFTVEAITFCGTIFQEQVSGSHTCPPCIGNTFDLGAMAICPGECFELLGSSYCTAGNYQVELFNPAVNCFETYIFNIEEIVEATLAVGPVSEFCEAANLFYMVGFQIESGNPPYYVNGNLVTGNFYQSGLIPTGDPYAFTVTDAATCTPQQVNVNGAFTCPCLNDPGTVELSLINACEGQMANAAFNNDTIISPNSILVFVLHTSPTNQPGTVIGMNTTGSFGYVPGMMDFGQTYYISPAVGPANGGSVDMASQCFSMAAGQPVVFYPMPAVDILQPDTLTCSVAALSISSLPSGGSGIFDYAWTGPNNFVSNVASPTISDPGVYALLLTDNLTGCQDQSATSVASNTVQPVFAVTTGEINCQQPNATLEASSQMPGLFYTWTLPTGDVITGASITTNIPGDYSVTAIGPNGCEADAVTNVADNGIPPSLTVNGGDSIINCSQPSVLLTASSNDPLAIITWTLPDSSTSVGPSLDASMVGDYLVSVLAPNGCTTEATTSVAQGPDPELAADLVATPPTCHGDTNGSIKVMGASGGNEPYIFQLNGAPFDGAVENLPAGDYLVSVEDANGCTDDIQLQLAEPEAVMVEIGDDLFINMGEQVTLSFQSNITPDSILWMGPNGQTWPGVSTLSIQPSENGTYFIVISDVSACRSSDTMHIYVNGQGRVYLPNVFSPNGDGQNDFMTVYAGNDVRKILNFQIFDRWGEMVFENKDFSPNAPDLGWNGRHKGRPMDPAVFVVKAEVEFLDGSKKVVMGDVVLLR